MRLTSLELKNFRQHVDTKLEFPPGVTGIIGKNGSGKTTILEAIAWALYGGSAVRGTNDTVRSKAAEGNSPVEVTLTFDLGPHTYIVTRRLEASGRTSANLSIDGNPSRAGFKEVTESITKLLGMDYQAFFTSFFTAQKEIDFMRGMDGRQRAASVSRMLGYERLIKARDKANQDRLGLQREIEGLERGLGNPEEIKKRKSEAKSAVSTAEKSLKTAEDMVSSTKKEVDRLKPMRDLSEQKAKLSSELVRRIELDAVEEKRAVARVDELTNELKDLTEKANELKSLEPKLEEYRQAGEEYKKLLELQKFESQKGELQGKIAAINYDLTSIKKRIDELSGVSEELKNIEKASEDLSTQISDLETRIEKEKDSLSAARHRAEAELTSLNAERQSVVEKRQTIEKAGPSGKCPTCERPLAEELNNVLAGFDEHIHKLDIRIEKLKTTISDLQKEPESLIGLVTLRQKLEKERESLSSKRAEAISRQAELDNCKKDVERKQQDALNLQAALDKLPSGFDQDRFNYLRELGEKLKPVRERAIEIKTALGRREGIENDLKREQDALARAQSDAEAAKSSLKELEFSQEEHDKLIESFDTAVINYNAANLEAERVRGDLKAAQAALSAAEADDAAYKSKEAELQEKRKKRVQLQTLAEAFDQLRNDLNSRTAPELAAAASDLLAEMTDGRYTALEVTEDYEAKIIDDGEYKPIISGGEDDIVNLSLRLAVSRMIADRAGQDLSLLVLDEVFASLDDIRRDNVVTLLQTLKSRFEQIIIITHVDAIHDAVDNCIWVEYDEGSKISRIKTGTKNEFLEAAGTLI